ncbi:YdeI/OmpD-associated family protein [Streptomyces sp. NBC_00178]|uniref:YdeI/OmpD-associated family protein n=1 Tax=Streptomyces sp. NBC_00178 TaxID=2975672 RepID=UPI002E29EE4F|nr:YdeI/OmpD-associated family protein [Streptomyces sp. NBC_00178]
MTSPRKSTDGGPAAEGPAGDAADPLFCERVPCLESWLERHHGERSELWLRIAKKGSGIASVTATEVIEAALCFGWIDGQRRSLDAAYYLQRISPRRRGSQWSLVNVRKVGELTEAGRMRESGLAEVHAAQADGRWSAAYPSQKEATVPPDLAAALAANPRAARRFERLGRTDRYLLILQLLRARTPEARATRLARMTAAPDRDRDREGG